MLFREQIVKNTVKDRNQKAAEEFKDIKNVFEAMKVRHINEIKYANLIIDRHFKD